MSDRIPQVLRRTAELLETDGWCQGNSREEARMCVWAAINAASDREHRDNLAQAWRRACKVSDILCDHLELANYDLLPCWNDTPGRTVEEVVDVLRTVANLRDSNVVETRREGVLV